MNILVYGGAGFIGTNLVKMLALDKSKQIVVVDKKKEYFHDIDELNYSNIICKAYKEFPNIEFEKVLEGIDIVYHLMSTSMPANTNNAIAKELNINVTASIELLDACIKKQIRKVVFISSGGTVYGKVNQYPIKENEQNYPITAYGIQKLTIEKVLYLYWHLYGLDYRIVRLANPYGYYQRPNGTLGVITTFTYNAIIGRTITVYGDGSIVRDYIFIDDAIRAILNITNLECKYKIFNVGSGIGSNINSIIQIIKNVVKKDIKVEYKKGRKVDVPINILDVSRYENYFGQASLIDLNQGIELTRVFLEQVLERDIEILW